LHDKVPTWRDAGMINMSLERRRDHEVSVIM
jgi:hypothetical protein